MQPKFKLASQKKIDTVNENIVKNISNYGIEKKKIGMNMNVELYHKAKIYCAKNNITLSGLVESLLSEKITEE